MKPEIIIEICEHLQKMTELVSADSSINIDIRIAALNASAATSKLKVEVLKDQLSRNQQ